MSAINPCNICNKNKPLLESHIIPKFVMKYARNQSLSPSSFFNLEGRTVQDLPKLNLLCKQCEQMLSQKGESLFSPKLFHPLNNAIKHNDKSFISEAFDEPWHHYFVVSVCWRATMSMIYNKTIPKFQRKEEKQLQNALNKWKAYLNGKCSTAGTYNVFLFPLYEPNEWNLNIPCQALNQYVEIAVDWCLLRRDKPNSVVVVIKLQRMFIVGQLTGRPWNDCQPLSIDDKSYIAANYLYLPELLTAYMAWGANDMSLRLQARRKQNPTKYQKRLNHLLNKHTLETIWNSEIYQAYEKDLEERT